MAFRRSNWRPDELRTYIRNERSKKSDITVLLDGTGPDEALEVTGTIIIYISRFC